MGVVLLPGWELVQCPTPYVGILLLPVRKLVHYVLPPMWGLYLHPCGSLYTPLKVYTHNHQVLEDIELALMWAAAISKYGTLNTCEPSLNLGIRITLLRVLSLGAGHLATAWTFTRYCRRLPVTRLQNFRILSNLTGVYVRPLFDQY